MVKRMEVGEFYMYETQKDVCIKVIGIEPSSKGINKVSVEYWNLGHTGRPWRISGEENTVRIHDSSLEYWYHLDFEVLTEKRYMAGLPKGVRDEQD